MNKVELIEKYLKKQSNICSKDNCSINHGGEIDFLDEFIKDLQSLQDTTE